LPRKSSTASRTAGRYWLFKSEPASYSIHKLAAAPARTTFWDGVRNYQARNMLRDEVQVGDRVFFYHSNAEPMGIFGTMEVVRAGYPDHTAFDPEDHHFDPKSDPDEPTWFMVDVRLLQVFPRPVTRDDLRNSSATSGMLVLARGSRLSIQPVTAAEWKAVHKLAGVEDL
jgi:predicted RNA-binding protein with PUA-like domain